MKPPGIPVVVLIAFPLIAPALASDFSVQLRRSEQAVQLAWPTSVQTPAGHILPEYVVERSFDLQSWSPIGGKVRALAGGAASMLNVSVDAVPGPVFYRVRADMESTATSQTASGGADVFGFNRALSDELAKLGFLTLEDFSAAYPPPAHLPSIDFDPTYAQFWTNFNTDPAEWNSTLPANSPDRRLYDFRLSPAEMMLFTNNGFVVSGRLSEPSFGDAYYKIYTDDLPVFITSDSILQAWHRSYVNMLSELEEVQLATLVEQMVTNMAAALPAAWAAYGQGDMRVPLLDADYYLTVARSLWADRQVPCSLSAVNQEGKVSATLTAIGNLRPAEFSLFGRTNTEFGFITARPVDFSQFTVRGHYVATDRLRRYFKTVMWLGRIDLRIADSGEDDVAQLGLALVLHDLLIRSGQFATWRQLEDVTRAFVGPTDSMTFQALSELLRTDGIASPATLTWAGLTNLQERLRTGELGVQAIIGDIFFSPLSPEQMKMPRSFTVLGQKFVADSWAMSQVAFDRVLWHEDPNTPFGKVIRRKPSGIDVAFSVLGNDNTTAIVAERVSKTNGVPFRDGKPYQHNLAAVRNVMDATDMTWWTNNIYSTWLYALRALSAPPTDTALPQAMRTHAWSMKDLNTQLASWTQLRHDTVLYAKQSYTPPFLCDYPKGFVEPAPEFWRRMRLLAEVTKNALSTFSMRGTVTLPPRTSEDPMPGEYNLQNLQRYQISFCTNFMSRMATLQSLAEKELASIPFTTEENNFVRGVVESVYTYIGKRQYNGWYPGLFYYPWSAGFAFHEDEGCGKHDQLVTDVHTDVPDPLVRDPGAIIHEAVGNANMMLIAVDNGPDRAVYAGPVFSYYEFEKPYATRLTDEGWKQMLITSPPPPPEWTAPFLGPVR